MITERVFQWRGMGDFLVTSVTQRRQRRAGLAAGGGGDRDRVQPDRRSALRVARPEDPLCLSARPPSCGSAARVSWSCAGSSGTGWRSPAWWSSSRSSAWRSSEGRLALRPQRHHAAVSSPPSGEHPMGTDDRSRPVGPGAARHPAVDPGRTAGGGAGSRRRHRLRGDRRVLRRRRRQPDDAVRRPAAHAPLLAILVCLSTLLTSGGGGSSRWSSAACVAVRSPGLRGVFLSLREKEYVEAGRCLGATNRRIIFRHLLPNAVGPIIVNATTGGVRHPGRDRAVLPRLRHQVPQHLARPAGQRRDTASAPGHGCSTSRGVIILIALTINFVGDGLRDALDPKQNRVRA